VRPDVQWKVPFLAMKSLGSEHVTPSEIDLCSRRILYVFTLLYTRIASHGLYMVRMLREATLKTPYTETDLIRASENCKTSKPEASQ